MNAARVTLRGRTVELRAALAELGAARLRWCLLCGRVGLWGWHPLTPSMPITWVCTDQPSCWQRQAAATARTRRRWRQHQARDGRAGLGASRLGPGPCRALRAPRPDDGRPSPASRSEGGNGDAIQPRTGNRS